MQKVSNNFIVGFYMMALASSVLATTRPNLDLSSAVVAGSHCNPTSTILTLAPDGENWILILEHPQLKAEVSAIQRAARSNCTVRIKADIPQQTKWILTMTESLGSAALGMHVDSAAAMTISLFNENAHNDEKRFSQTVADFRLVDSDAYSSNCVSRVQEGFLGINLAVSLTSSGDESGASSLSKTMIHLQSKPCL